jgi:hypothetical protein
MLLIFAYAILMLLAFVGDPAEGGERIQRVFVLAILVTSFIPGVIGARLLLNTIMPPIQVSNVRLIFAGLIAIGVSAALFMLDMERRGVVPLLFLPIAAYIGVALVSLAFRKTRSV